MPFIGKVVLITGASGGIGASCAEYFAKKGALLALVGRNAEKFERVVERIKESGVELEPLVIIADVSVDAERIISETIEKYEHLDILINNAGFSLGGTLETLKMDDYDAMMNTNVRGVVELTQLAIPYLAKTKGNIVQVSSAAGIIPVPIFFAYAMSKAALDHFTKCAAIELAPKQIRVNSVNPGFIDTDFHTIATGIERDDGDYNEIVEQAKSKHPLQRIGNAEDCVNAIAFLADEGANFITGVLLRVDGGLSTKGAF
ncbi:uncharacterized oxidoreductase TM_0325-like [Sitodiplosis mosellana]|uniref:uncharacterized oxidoreductase TM_0325-like n=1 Tax=Sitodiplosis mosellana TaxID=263140 RepID=UPI002445057A|nr:uncharacterized oxidoreductase TM_0325-like [Sitodiplosis mosellana]